MPWRERGAAGRLSHEETRLGLGRDHLYRAEQVLRDWFSLVLVTEWLDTAGSGLLLARALCFEWPRVAQLVPRGAGAGMWMEVPDLAPKRYSSRRGDPPVGWLASVRDDYSREDEEGADEGREAPKPNPTPDPNPTPNPNLILPWTLILTLILIGCRGRQR